MPVIYTVKLDSRYPYALVLKEGSTQPEKYEGSTARELHEHMRDTFGPDVQRLPGSQFQAEVEKRQTHTPEMVTLLDQHGLMLGQDLTRYVVYGSLHRPMDSLWARIEDAVYIQSDKGRTGYYTYVAVPARLDEEMRMRYELEFVSHAGDVE